MLSETQAPNEDLITRWQYIRGRLGILWSFLTIKKTIKHLENIFVENRESWGSMLEETAAKFPDNAADGYTSGSIELINMGGCPSKHP